MDKHEICVGFTDPLTVVGEDDGLIFRLALEEIDKLDALIGEVSRAVAKEAFKDPRVELLLGFKGIDYYTAMVVLN